MLEKDYEVPELGDPQTDETDAGGQIEGPPVTEKEDVEDDAQ